MDSNRTQAAADRLAAKLDALDLDDDERAVLGAILNSGAHSVEQAGDEVAGFAFASNLGFGADTGGLVPSAMPAESLTLSFTQVVFTYTPQRPDGSQSEKK